MKIKPEEISSSEEALIDAVCSYFDRVYDDKEEVRSKSLRGLQRNRGERNRKKWQFIMGNDPTINETAEAFNLPTAKVRKLLIAGRMYDTALFRHINELVAAGKSVAEVPEVVGKKAGTVKSYLKYKKVIYKYIIKNLCLKANS